MILELATGLVLCLAPTAAFQGEDMDDSDFGSYVDAHDDFREKAEPYARAAAEGCAQGAAGAVATGNSPVAGCAGGACAGVVGEAVKK